MSAQSAIEQRLKIIGAPEKNVDNNQSFTKQWDQSLRKFSAEIDQYWLDNRQTEEEFDKKLIILKEIETYLKEKVFNKPIDAVKYELKAVVPFGSSASGLGMTGGDLDMIVCVHPALDKKRQGVIKKRCNSILTVIFERIETGAMLPGRSRKEMEHIEGARVPIITGFVDGVEIDISISMTTIVSAQYLASKFIDAYEKYDTRFIRLAAFVKAWQKSKKTDENEVYFKTVFPNSCSTVLLVVFFMKYYKMLPDINKKHYDKLSDARVTWKMVRQGENGSFGVVRKEVANWKLNHHCDVTLGTLFLLFVDFYGNIVNFKTQTLDIASGGFKNKRKKFRVYRVMIEDVLDKDNAAKSVVEAGMFVKFLKDAQEIVEDTEPEFVYKELMAETLRDINTYTKSEIKELREKGLHAAPHPPIRRW